MNGVRNNSLTVVIIAAKGKPTMVVTAEAQVPPLALRPGDDYLEPGEVLSLPRVGQTLHVVSGCAWITLDGEDLILWAGQALTLEPGIDAAVVSALEDTPLVYRVFG